MFLSVLTKPSVTFVKGAEMDASQQFWVSEDLLEHLLPMLDLPTLAAIASVNPLVVSLLSRPSMWCQLLKRTCQFPYAEEYDGVAGWTQEEYSSILLKAPMIANILNMMECQESRLLEFLDHIGQTFPLIDDENSFEFVGKIKLNLGGSSRTISNASFIFLEQVVSYLDSKVMEVEEVTLVLVVEDALAERALVSQLSRQQAALRFLKIDKVLGTSDTFFALTGKSSSWSLRSLWLCWEDESTWRRLAEVSTRGEISFLHLESISSLGCPETVRNVWLATETMEINIDGLPAATARARANGLLDGNALAQRGPARLALIPKEDGESGWAEILKIIAERDHIATRKRKRGVF